MLVNLDSAIYILYISIHLHTYISACILICTVTRDGDGLRIALLEQLGRSLCSGNWFTSNWIIGVVLLVQYYWIIIALLNLKCIFDTTNCAIYSSIKSWSYSGINFFLLIFSWFVCLFIDFHVDLRHKGTKSGEWSQLNMLGRRQSLPPSIFIPFLKELRSVLAAFQIYEGVSGGREIWLSLRTKW